MDETQQHGGDLTAPPASHRAPHSKHAMSGDGMQASPGQNRALELRVIRFLASLICLAVAVYYFWSTHDWVVFLVLVGVATGQIGIWEALGWSRRRPEQARLVEQGGDE
jgi:hypothetical protein